LHLSVELSILKYFKNYNRKKTRTSFFLRDGLSNPLYSIGSYTYGRPTIFEWGEGACLEIGKFCSIADKVNIFLGGYHRSDWASTYPFNKILPFKNIAHNIHGHPSSKGNVIIGNDVWIGYGATILSGIKVGSGSIIGAYSVVTKDVLPYEIVAGNPARHIRFRFDDLIINNLMKIEWWNLE
jgi:virginiamycin A acetyltransferase